MHDNCIMNFFLVDDIDRKFLRVLVQGSTIKFHEWNGTTLEGVIGSNRSVSAFDSVD